MLNVFFLSATCDRAPDRFCATVLAAPLPTPAQPLPQRRANRSAPSATASAAAAPPRGQRSVRHRGADGPASRGEVEQPQHHAEGPHGPGGAAAGASTAHEHLMTCGHVVYEGSVAHVYVIHDSGGTERRVRSKLARDGHSEGPRGLSAMLAEFTLGGSMRWNLLRNTSARAYLPTGPTLVVWGQCLDSDCGTAEALYVEDSEATPHIDFS